MKGIEEQLEDAMPIHAACKCADRRHRKRGLARLTLAARRAGIDDETLKALRSKGFTQQLTLKKLSGKL